MRVGLIALGTRGDVQPYLALGKALKAAGHSVQFMAGRNFEAMVTAQGLDFVPSVDMEAVMKSEAGRKWAAETSHNPRKQLGQMKKLLQEYGDEMVRPIYTDLKNSDLLIAGTVSVAYAYAVAEKYDIPLISALLQPFLPTRSGAASMVAAVSRGNSWLNILSGRFAQRIMWGVGKETTNKLRTATLGLASHTAKDFLQTGDSLPTLQAFSRYIVPPPPDQASHVYTTGYWFLEDEATLASYRPEPELAEFLASGPAPIYMGFGSMTDSKPGQTLELMQQALAQTGQRAIIGGGWGGTDSHSVKDANILWLKEAPHGWLFPRCAAVVHHGGAGTTAAGLRAGVPALLVPHMSDQPYWGRRVYELGVGVKPIPRHKLTAENLAQAITQLTTDATLKEKAVSLGQQIRDEDGLGNALAAIEQIMANMPKKALKAL